MKQLAVNLTFFGIRCQLMSYFKKMLFKVRNVRVTCKTERNLHKEKEISTDRKKKNKWRETVVLNIETLKQFLIFIEQFSQ